MSFFGFFWVCCLMFYNNLQFFCFFLFSFDDKKGVLFVFKGV